MSLALPTHFGSIPRLPTRSFIRGSFSFFLSFSRSFFLLLSVVEWFTCIFTCVRRVSSPFRDTRLISLGNGFNCALNSRSEHRKLKSDSQVINVEFIYSEFLTKRMIPQTFFIILISTRRTYFRFERFAKSWSNYSSLLFEKTACIFWQKFSRTRTCMICPLTVIFFFNENAQFCLSLSEYSSCICISRHRI